MSKSKIRSKADFIEFISSQQGEQPHPAQSALLVQLLDAMQRDAEPWLVGALTWEYAYRCINRAEVFGTLRVAHMEMAKDAAAQVERRHEWLREIVAERGYDLPLTQGQLDSIWRAYKPAFHAGNPKASRRSKFNRDVKSLNLRSSR